MNPHPIMKSKIKVAVADSMHLRAVTIVTAHDLCGAKYTKIQPKDDDLTEHYEFNWCLRSRPGGCFSLRNGTTYH